MSSEEWKKRCAEELGLHGVPLPDTVDWESVYRTKPLGRNLLRNPDPHGLTKDRPPPEPERAAAPPAHGPPRFEPDGDFAGWTTSTEVLPYCDSPTPPGVVVCQVPRYGWFTAEQTVDLKAEGLWDEMLDAVRPDILVQDFYEESQVHESVYRLRARLLGADGRTAVSEYAADPAEDLGAYSHAWKEVRHVFSGYGPGVRYVHFLHSMKSCFMVELYPTLATGSAVIVRPTRSNC